MTSGEICDDYEYELTAVMPTQPWQTEGSQRRCWEWARMGPRGQLLTDRRPTAAGSARSIASERAYRKGWCMSGGVQHSVVDVMPGAPLAQSDMQTAQQPQCDGRGGEVS